MDKKKFEYKILKETPTLETLNKEGAEGWIVIDIIAGHSLMMREYRDI